MERTQAQVFHLKNARLMTERPITPKQTVRDYNQPIQGDLKSLKTLSSFGRYNQTLIFQ